MLLATLFIFGLFHVLNACEDGKDNVVKIYDLLEENAKVRFVNVTVAVYGIDKKPLCSKLGPLIQFPGFLKFFTGQVEIVEPLKFKKGALRIQFTTEHSSFFIGQVCLNGESANAFVPSEICESDFCEIIEEEKCKLLTEKQTLDVHQLYTGYFELPEMLISEVSGEWKAEASLVIRGNELARIRVGEEHKWIQIEISDKNKHEEL